MVKQSHFEIEILQDDVAVKEYADKNAGNALDQETRYVEVKEGKAFAIRLTVDEHFDFEKYDALSVEISIDGKSAGGFAASSTRSMKVWPRLMSSKDSQSSETARRT